MTQKNKTQETNNKKRLKKSISTFSLMVESQHEGMVELIKDLQSSYGIEELVSHSDNASRLLTGVLYLPFNNQSVLAQEHMTQLFDSIKFVIEESNAALIQSFASQAPTFDALSLFYNSMSVETSVFKNIEGAYINLPIGELQKSISDIKIVDLDITDCMPHKELNHEYMLRTITRETTDLGIIKLRNIQETQLRVRRDVKKIKQLVTEDAKKKDEMLEELLDYFRGKDAARVMIQKIIYNKKSAELQIDDKIIKLKMETNQHYLCKILFASKYSMKKVWEIYDVVEALGEDTENLDAWIKIIYATVRHLNEKIQVQTGLEKFILFGNKTIIVNPKYLNIR